MKEDEVVAVRDIIKSSLTCRGWKTKVTKIELKHKQTNEKKGDAMDIIEKSVLLTPVSGIVNIAIGILRRLAATLAATFLYIKYKFTSKEKKEIDPFYSEKWEVAMEKILVEIFQSANEILRGARLIVPIISSCYRTKINEKSADFRAWASAWHASHFERCDRHQHTEFKPTPYGQLF